MPSEKKRYILAIDAGGTKTLGQLKCLSSEKTWKIQVGSASLSHNLSKACSQIESVAKNLLHQSQCKPEQVLVVCGAAGAGNEKNKKALHKQLSQTFSNVKVCNDGKTSLYGAGMGRPIIVLALGTGSVAMRLDKDYQETQFGGWGFIAGDLGSGAYMGKQLVSLALVELDKRQFNRDILISETIKLLSQSGKKEKASTLSKTGSRTPQSLDEGISIENEQSIAEWIKNASPTDYASLAPFLFKYAEQSAFAQKILKDSANWIEDLAKTAGFKNDNFSDLPVAIIGGLSQAVKPYLSRELRDVLVISKGSALDGAHYLGEKHISAKSNFR